MDLRLSERCKWLSFECCKPVLRGEIRLTIVRRESAVFFILLAIMGVGFFQSLYALDAADGESGGGNIVVNGLIQALLGSPDFDSPSERFGYPFGLIIYYSWNFLSTIILVNVLIALFGSAYSDVEENATDEYLAFFAHKTIDLIRAPDSYVYPAPFNLVEAVCIAPLEYILPGSWYIRLNQVVMSSIFFIPLTLIAIFESQFAHNKNRRLANYFADFIEDDLDDPNIQDPKSDDDDEGEICTETFETLVKQFPK